MYLRKLTVSMYRGGYEGNKEKRNMLLTENIS